MIFFSTAMSSSIEARLACRRSTDNIAALSMLNIYSLVHTVLFAISSVSNKRPTITCVQLRKLSRSWLTPLPWWFLQFILQWSRSPPAATRWNPGYGGRCLFLIKENFRTATALESGRTRTWNGCWKYCPGWGMPGSALKFSKIWKHRVSRRLLLNVSLFWVKLRKTFKS